MRKLIGIIILVIYTVGCSEKYTPKPRGYFRIDFPEKSYHKLGNTFPFNFDVPDYSLIIPDSKNRDKPYWINIAVPENKAEIHLSFYDIQQSQKPDKLFLAELMEETRTLAYKHSIKADAIEEQIFMNHPEKVFGTIYKIQGNAASPMQFFLTDSTKYFLRGALYIREIPRIDSLRPVIDFLEPDVIRLIETTTWN